MRFIECHHPPVERLALRARAWPDGHRRCLWSSYRAVRRAMRSPETSAGLGEALARRVQAGTPYDVVSLALKLAQAVTLEQTRREGATARVRRALAAEALHLARLELRAALGHRTSANPPRWSLGPEPGPRAWVAFSDGSCRTRGSGAGIVLQAPGAACRADIALALGAGTSLDAELAAATLALQTLLALGAREAHLQTDSLCVLQAFRQRLPLRYCVPEAELARLAAAFDALVVTRVPRLYNHAADRLACSA